MSDTALTVAYTLVGTLLGSETMQLWKKPAGGSWSLAQTDPITSLTGSITASGLLPGRAYDLAIRVMRAGIANTGASSATPTDWPAGQQSNGVTTVPAPTLDALSWARTGATEETVTAVLAGDVILDDASVDYVLQVQAESGGAWTDLATTSDRVNGTCSAVVSGHNATTPRFRVRQETSAAASDPSSDVALYMGPVMPTNVTIADSGLASVYTIAWDADAIADTLVSCETSDVGEWGSETLVSDDTSGNASGLCPTSLSGVHGRARHRVTNFGVDDYSLYRESTNDVPPNCV